MNNTTRSQMLLTAFSLILLIITMAKTISYINNLRSKAAGTTIRLKIALQGTFDKVITPVYKTKLVLYTKDSKVKEYKDVPLVLENDNFFILENDLSGIELSNNYAVFIKPDKYVGKIFCSEKTNGPDCQIPQLIFQKDSVNNFDFTKYIINAGDLQTQDGKVDSYDISKILSDLGEITTDYLESDVNSDHVVNVMDYSLVLYSLSQNAVDDKIVFPDNPLSPSVSINPLPTQTPTSKPTITPNQTTPTSVPIPTLSPIISSPSPIPTSPLTLTPTTLAQIVKKVMIIDINPVLPNYGNKKLRQFKNWSNIDSLNSQFISDITTASKNYVRYQIVDIMEMNEFPVKDDGFQYTDSQYIACLNNFSQCHSPDIPNGNLNMYRSLLNRFQVCKKRNADVIDEVWIWGGPWFGFFEANMTGPNAWSTNGPVISGSTCTKPLHIMAYNYERGIATMEESFNHRIDGTLSHFFANSWNMNHPHLGSPKNDWEKFTIINIDSPKPAACGDTHYPPNGTQDYDFSNSTYVNSSCKDWLNYPNLTGTTVRINCSAWNCDHHQYYVWRMSYIPKASGIKNGMNNNWWTYIVRNY